MPQQGTIVLVCWALLLFALVSDATDKMNINSIPNLVLRGKQNAAKFNGTFDRFRARLNSPDVKHYQHNTNLPKKAQVIFVKTHKVGSGTMGGTQLRFAARHKTRVVTLYDQKKISQGKNNTYDSYFMHIQPVLRMKKLKWTFPTFMRDLEKVIAKPFKFTLLRDPTSHYLSHAASSKRFKTGSVIDKSFIEEMRPNMQCDEFDIQSESNLQKFLKNDFDRFFHMACVTEYFDECLVILRRKMNWDMLDITYLRVHDANEESIVKSRVHKPPSFSQLHHDAQQAILDKTVLDRKLYAFALDRWKKIMAAEPMLEHEVQVFRSVLSALSDTCQGTPDHPACVWYSLDPFNCVTWGRSRVKLIPFS